MSDLINFAKKHVIVSAVIALFVFSFLMGILAPIIEALGSAMFDMIIIAVLVGVGVHFYDKKNNNVSK